LPQYLELVERAQVRATRTIWYRGCGKAGHPLLPSLYRHQRLKTPDQLADLERKLMTRFRQRSVPYHSRSLTDDWDALFFMQHYGVPTRLLDWTENPLIALHFALMGAPKKVTKSGILTFQSDAAVWMLDPVAWNRHALRHVRFAGEVLTPDDEDIKGYRPIPQFAGMNSQPVALYGAHNSARIVAQQGVFTIFGRDAKPMDDVFMADNFPANCLTKIVLSKSVIRPLRKSLLNQGITESVVFPDLEGLARELQRVFGFEV
jgi:hypothetical protein